MKKMVRSFVNNGVFFAAISIVFLFCVWVKSWWDEPLGFDGAVLFFVLCYPFRHVGDLVESAVFSDDSNRQDGPT